MCTLPSDRLPNRAVVRWVVFAPVMYTCQETAFFLASVEAACSHPPPVCGRLVSEDFERRKRSTIALDHWPKYYKTKSSVIDLGI